MAGKSTFLRQTALITLMAQIGSFVPAEEATVGIVDSIFCRVGATDNLARGESTFLVEMNETAHILRAATRSSLIIMDEIGRGTSTQDGLAIAWAVSMYILERICARTLFATHFHELTGLAHARATNLSMEVLEREGEIVFLKKVREGPSNNSYGIHVAKLAGLPAETLQYAERMLAEMGSAGKGGGTTFPPPAHPVKPPLRQQELFSAEQIVIHYLLGMSPENTTPLEALRRIARWRDELQREKAGGESEGRNGRGTSSPRGDPRE
jgi:DNA mismatch repair protein MutS